MPPDGDPVPTEIGYDAPPVDPVFCHGCVRYSNGIIRIGQFDGSVKMIEDEDEGFGAMIGRAIMIG